MIVEEIFMNRSKLREIIIKILYETYIYETKDLNYNLDDLIKEQLETQNEFVTKTIFDIKNQQEKLNNIANKYMKNWNIERLSKVDKAIISLGIYELLFTDYKHTILGMGSEDDGYPMANAEIRKTIDDYIDGEPNPGLDKGYNYDSEDYALINTHSRTRGLIDEGYPVIISMTKYNTSSLVNTSAYGDDLSPSSTKNTSKEKYHSVVVYGYDNNDRFLVHYGFNNDSEIIISGATIYSYYALKFTGTHICSYNFYTSSSKLEGQTPTVDYYMCAGCGKIYDENKYPIN